MGVDPDFSADGRGLTFLVLTVAGLTDTGFALSTGDADFRVADGDWRAGFVALEVLRGLTDFPDEREGAAFCATLPADGAALPAFVDFVGFTATARGRLVALALAGTGFFFDFATVNRFSFPRKDLALYPHARPSGRPLGQKTGQNNGCMAWGQLACGRFDAIFHKVLCGLDDVWQWSGQ